MKIKGNLNTGKQQEVAGHLLSLVQVALDRWYKGDPYGYLAIYDEENYTYFDPSKTTKIDSFDEIKAFYDTIIDLVHSSDYSIVDPIVQFLGNAAVLTCNILAHVGADINKWNSTEVFQLNANDKWKVVHSHWAFIRPMDIVFDSGKEIV